MVNGDKFASGILYLPRSALLVPVAAATVRGGKQVSP
jgi:hypothetical protein